MASMSLFRILIMMTYRMFISIVWRAELLAAYPYNGGENSQWPVVVYYSLADTSAIELTE